MTCLWKNGTITLLLIRECGSGGTADALASGASGGNPVEVQILSTAPFIIFKNAVVVERQTRYFEGVVGETPYGFKSHRPHQKQVCRVAGSGKTLELLYFSDNKKACWKVFQHAFCVYIILPGIISINTEN